MPTNDYTAGRPELGLTDDGALTLDYPDGRLVVLSLEPNGQTTTYTALGRHMGPERVPASRLGYRIVQFAVDYVPRIATTPELQRKLLVDNPMRLYWN